MVALGTQHCARQRNEPAPTLGAGMSSTRVSIAPQATDENNASQSRKAVSQSDVASITDPEQQRPGCVFACATCTPSRSVSLSLEESGQRQVLQERLNSSSSIMLATTKPSLSPAASVCDAEGATPTPASHKMSTLLVFPSPHDAEERNKEDSIPLEKDRSCAPSPPTAVLRTHIIAISEAVAITTRKIDKNETTCVAPLSETNGTMDPTATQVAEEPNLSADLRMDNASLPKNEDDMVVANDLCPQEETDCNIFAVGASKEAIAFVEHVRASLEHTRSSIMSRLSGSKRERSSDATTALDPEQQQQPQQQQYQLHHMSAARQSVPSHRTSTGLQLLDSKKAVALQDAVSAWLQMLSSDPAVSSSLRDALDLKCKLFKPPPNHWLDDVYKDKVLPLRALTSTIRSQVSKFGVASSHISVQRMILDLSGSHILESIIELCRSRLRVEQTTSLARARSGSSNVNHGDEVEETISPISQLLAEQACCSPSNAPFVVLLSYKPPSSSSSASSRTSILLMFGEHNSFDPHRSHVAPTTMRVAVREGEYTMHADSICDASSFLRAVHAL